MRILFLLSGDIWIHTLPEGFREAGHDILMTSVHSAQELLNMLTQHRPKIAISIGWGNEQSKENQMIIRRCLKRKKVPHVYWSVEDPEYTLAFSVPLIQGMQPDFVFTICRESVTYYRQLGYKSAYMDFGFSPQIHHSLAYNHIYDIVVVANAYPLILSKYPLHFRHHSLKILIEPLLSHNIKIDFWGRDWEDMHPHLIHKIPPEWLHGPVDYRATAEIYNSAGIIIGLQNYACQVTQRTYEILASGGFLLTLDTSGVKKLFVSGEDLVCSSTPEQTLELIGFYQKHPDLRKTIANQGQRTVLDHSYKNRAEYMLRVLKEEKIID